MKISAEQFAKIVEEEAANVLKENLLSKMLGSVTDLYTRLNVGDKKDPEEKGKKEKISKESYDEVAKEFAEYFIKYGKPLSQKREALAIFQATTQAGFSNVVELETSPPVTESLLEEAIDDYKGDYYIAYNKLGSFFIRFKDQIYKKIEFELNRRFAYIIKNTFAGSLQRFQQNLTDGIDKTAEAIRTQMSSGPYKKNLLEQVSFRTVLKLAPIVEKVTDEKTLIAAEKELLKIKKSVTNEETKTISNKNILLSVNKRIASLKTNLLKTNTKEQYQEVLSFDERFGHLSEKTKIKIIEIITDDEELSTHRANLRDTASSSNKFEELKDKIEKVKNKPELVALQPELEAKELSKKEIDQLTDIILDKLNELEKETKQ